MRPASSAPESRLSGLAPRGGWRCQRLARAEPKPWRRGRAPRRGRVCQRVADAAPKPRLSGLAAYRFLGLARAEAHLGRGRCPDAETRSRTERISMRVTETGVAERAANGRISAAPAEPDRCASAR